MTATQTPGGDYVPAGPERKKRLTRGRKALIGFVVVAAAGAAAGGGTFASFTASTDNASSADPFSAADNTLVLGNTVGLDSGAADNLVECLSTDNDVQQNAATCANLFDVTTDVLDGAYVQYIRLENHSTAPATSPLALVAPGGCVSTPSVGGADLCAALEIEIEELANVSTGNGAIVAPADLMSATGIGSAEDGAVNDYVDCAVGDDSTPGGACEASVLLNTLPTTPSEIVAALPLSDDSTNTGVRYYKVTVTVPELDGCTGTAGVSTDDVLEGIGCGNHLAGGEAAFMLRWILQ